MNEIDKMAVAQRIKDLRISLGLSMEEFGKKLSTSKGAVNNWEKGKNLPNNYRLKTIAELGETTVEYLLTGRISIQDAVKQNISMKTYAEANGFSSSKIAKHDKIYKENIDILSEQVKTHFERAFNSALYSLMEIHQKSPDKFIELAVFLEILSDIPLEEEKQTTQQKEILDFIRKVTFND